jgi:predicted nucleotidyltransferase component of viral defense system
MIPFDFITEWRSEAPWVSDLQVEQDLILTRAVVDLFSHGMAAGALAFRGGTALHKLFLAPAARYSEDLDLVQVKGGPIGPTLSAIRSVLDPWLGSPKWTASEGRVTLIYRTTSEGPPSLPMKLKVEINSREHFAVFGYLQRELTVSSRWHRGSASVTTYALDELLGTKMRALYQRKNGRDLFDLWLANERAAVDADRVVECFRRYLEHEGQSVSRAAFEENLLAKLADPRFGRDVEPLVAPSTHWSTAAAGRYVLGELASRLPGEPWKGAGASSGH